MLPSLQAFFAQPEHLSIVTRIIGCRESRQGKPSPVSLRVCDWFLSNYSKAKRVFVRGADAYVAYKSSLRGLSKSLFDPFARANSITIKDSQGRDMLTTVAQLNWFRWAIINGIIDFCITHKKLIEADLAARGRGQSKARPKRPPAREAAGSPKARSPSPAPKRRALSKAPAMANVVISCVRIEF